MYGSASTASLHISCGLKITEINANERGFLRTSLLHASLVPGVYFSMYNKIYPITFLNELIILFIPMGPGEDVAMVTTYKDAVLFNHFHNPHFHDLAHHLNLRCWLYAQQLR